MCLTCTVKKAKLTNRVTIQVKGTDPDIGWRVLLAPDVQTCLIHKVKVSLCFTATVCHQTNTEHRCARYSCEQDKKKIRQTVIGDPLLRVPSSKYPLRCILLPSHCGCVGTVERCHEGFWGAQHSCDELTRCSCNNSLLGSLKHSDCSMCHLLQGLDTETFAHRASLCIS
jgi:hypothetical protein